MIMMTTMVDIVMSCDVTEDEVEHGILNSNDATAQTLCYVREIEDIQVNLESKKTHLYTDINQGQHDIEAQQHLDHLKRQRILNKLGEENVTHYTVPWTSDGINVNDRRHQEYLQKFCNKFESDIQRLIDRSLDVMSHNKLDQNTLYKEVLHHAWFCRDKCAAFRGRQDILGHVNDFLCACSHKLYKPLVIYGSSGSGKTSIMAVIVNKAKEWLGRHSVCVFRFLGTSPDTSNIILTLTSITRQIHEVFDLGPLKEEITEDFSRLVRHFHELLLSPQITAEKPLLLVIDSIDQLTPSFNAHLMNWLPKSCPLNVNIIISVLPGYYDILPTLRRSLRDDECYIEVPSLTKETGHQILDAWLEGNSRTLTESQRAVVMESFSQCPQPLFLKLIYTEASQWSSYTDISGISLGASVKEAITFLFDRLERKHGKVIVAHALGYITAARHGLTENELEDILSLDDDVIDDVYQYWDPPVEGVVRLPNLLWARIRHDINEFLVERQADKKTIVTWYHRQFWESAELRYLSDGEEKISRHALMCEYFQGTWGGGCKKHITLTRRKKALPDADRQVASQPLLFAKDVYNLRKLSELPFHLIKAEKLGTLKNEVLFNFEWINAKIHGQSLNDVLEDYENALRDRRDMEIRLAKETLVLSSSNIKHDSNSLAPQIIARMLAFKDHYSNIATLIDHAYRWCYARGTAFLIPMSPCLISAGHFDLIWALAVSKDDHVIVSASKDDMLRVWRSDNGECLQTLIGHSSWISCVAMTTDGDVIISGSNDKNVKLWKARGNAHAQELPIPSDHFLHHKAQPEAITMTTDGQWGVSGAKEDVMKIWDIKHQKCLYSLPGSVSCVTKSPTHPYAVTGSHNGTVTIWDCVTPSNSIVSFKGHEGSVTKIVVTQEGSQIISGGADGSKDSTIKLWNLTTEECEATFEGHKKDVSCLVATADNKTFVSGSTDFTVKIWSTDHREPIHTVVEYNDSITDIVMTTDNRCVIAGSHESKLQLRMWDIKTGACVKSFHGHTHAVMRVNIVRAHDMLLSSSRDGTLNVWDIASGTLLSSFDFQSQVKHFDFSPESENHYSLIAATKSGTVGIIKLWNPHQHACANMRTSV
ncbi:hypothetical protein QZH41_007442 [Actinostola sp. cb2023]|nr:hypothetical protein QZH41_007442 [Actinostola sp. cb2023]